MTRAHGARRSEEPQARRDATSGCCRPPITGDARLERANVDITLVDRENHHTFQPLLYQVATTGLNEARSAVAAALRM